MIYGTWRFRMNYSSVFEGLPLGTPVSALSEEFILSSGDGCPTGTGGGSSSKGNGGVVLGGSRGLP